MISFRYRVYTIVIISLLFLASVLTSLFLWVCGFISNQIMLDALLRVGGAILFVLLIGVITALVCIVISCIKDLRKGL